MSFVQTQYEETYRVELNLNELNLTSAGSKTTYDEIKACVLNNAGLEVSFLYIAQVKRKC